MAPAPPVPNWAGVPPPRARQPVSLSNKALDFFNAHCFLDKFERNWFFFARLIFPMRCGLMRIPNAEFVPTVHVFFPNAMQRFVFPPNVKLFELISLAREDEKVFLPQRRSSFPNAKVPTPQIWISHRPAKLFIPGCGFALAFATTITTRTKIGTRAF